MKPAEVFPPGAHLREEMKARGMSVVELAEIIGTTHGRVSALRTGRKNITPFIALQLEAVFGISAETWMALRVNWELHLQRKQFDPVVLGEIKQRKKAWDFWDE